MVAMVYLNRIVNVNMLCRNSSHVSLPRRRNARLSLLPELCQQQRHLGRSSALGLIIKHGVLL